jgi:ATP-binding cassette subfamily F protein 3
VPIEVPPERKRVRFTFPTAPKSGRAVLDLKGVRKTYGTTRVFEGIDLLIERGDRVALIGPNGAGKSTLMRILSGVEAPDAGTRTEGHQVVMQYFAQDEATRLDPTRTVYETLEAGSPIQMVPAIRTILGGFLFGGDDIYKKAGVLSGGERTRLAVARMLLRPANTLLLDEPTNHLDMDSKDVLLDALEDFGGTLILVSHDRYFIDKLATKVIDVGGGTVRIYPGGYEEYRWSLAKREEEVAAKAAAVAASTKAAPKPPPPPSPGQLATVSPKANQKPAAPKPGAGAQPPIPAKAGDGRDDRKRQEAEERRRKRAREAVEGRIATLEATIAEREAAMKTLETAMSAPGFYENHDTSKPMIDQHQALMWELGDLMHRWEELQQELAAASR